MDSVPHASHIPRAGASSEADATRVATPASQAAPGLSQPDADSGIRRFFQASAAHAPAHAAAQPPGHSPPVLSQAWSTLPPQQTED